MGIDLGRRLPAGCLDGITRGRNQLFDWGIFPQRQLPVPVLSVGNIVVGGAGKTPVVVAICEELIRLGRHPVVLSRGYGRSGSGFALVDGNADRAAHLFGDEPVLIARRLGSRGHVAVGSKRFQLGTWVLNQLPDPQKTVFVLDDGFQHRWLKRDQDWIVTPALSKSRLEQEWQIWPLGRARESAARAWSRVHTCVWLRSESDLRELPQAQWTQRVLLLTAWRRLRWLTPDRDQSGDAAALMKNQPVYVVCALARPEQFPEFLERQGGCRVVGHRFFTDHHSLTRAEWDQVLVDAKLSGAEHVVVSEKDAVKGLPLGAPITVAGMDLVWDRPDLLEECLRGLLQKKPQVGSC